jgi:hypothetical protein
MKGMKQKERGGKWRKNKEGNKERQRKRRKVCRWVSVGELCET